MDAAGLIPGQRARKRSSVPVAKAQSRTKVVPESIGRQILRLTVGRPPQTVVDRLADAAVGDGHGRNPGPARVVQ